MVTPVGGGEMWRQGGRRLVAAGVDRGWPGFPSVAGAARRGFGVALSVGLALLLFSTAAAARCRQQSLVRGPSLYQLDPAWPWRGAVAASLPEDRFVGVLRRASWSGASSLPLSLAAESARVTLTWYGHSFFRLLTEGGTSIAMDPFHGDLGLPLPEVDAHAVTVGREHRNHNNVALPRGEPLILRGVDLEAGGWRRVDQQVREVRISGVPIYQRAYWGEMVNGSAFLFEVGDLCIAHLGDIGSELSPAQLENFGSIDVALVPIGGRYSADPATARRILEQLRPKIAVPMHYWDSEYNLGEFVKGFPRVYELGGNHLTVTKSSLPPETTILIMRR